MLGPLFDNFATVSAHRGRCIITANYDTGAQAEAAASVNCADNENHYGVNQNRGRRGRFWVNKNSVGAG